MLVLGRQRFAGFLGMLLLLLSGCARNPVTGRPEVTLVSEAKEREIGEAEARSVAETMGIFDDPGLAGYVRAVGERLARFSPRTDVTYTFQIVDMEEPNAFALPGGPVYVSRGLLVLMNSEDQLAGVLAHEIGHIAARHAVQRVTRAAPLAVVTGLGAAVTGIVSPTLGDLVGGVGGAAGALVLAPYSRDQEREADRIGQDIEAAAGWDPAGLSGALRTLERDDALHRGEKRPNSFFATHPPLPDRVAATEAYAATLQRPATAVAIAGPGGVLQQLDGLPVGPRAADGVFDAETFLDPDLDFRVRFPAGWKTANERTIVGASAPDGRAVVGLELIGKGNDPEAALRAFQEKAKIDLASGAERTRVGALPAIHAATSARTRDGRVALDLTWIAYAGRIFRFTGVTPLDAAASAAPAFRATVMSFRPLTASERAGIRETRLRLGTARAGERLSDVLARSGNTWSLEKAAVANGIETTMPLRAGQRVKVAVAEPYAGGR
jgi:predicted Zn-dependent protease